MLWLCEQCLEKSLVPWDWNWACWISWEKWNRLWR